MSGSCSCYSGFTGSDCAVNNTGLDISCTFPTVAPLVTAPVAEFIKAQSSIKNSKFTFVVESPSTFNRYFQEVSLGGVAACSYPVNTDLTKTFDHCHDVFTGVVDIRKVRDTCGFAQATAANKETLTGTVHVHAVDTLGEFRGHAISRSTKAVHKLVLSLPTFVNLTTTQLTIFSPVELFAAVTYQEYTASTDSATITLTTSVQWPYLLTSQSISSKAYNFGVDIVATDVQCASDVAGTDCLQTFEITFSDVTKLAGGNTCRLDGFYGLEWTYGCRAGQNPCPVPGTDIVGANFTLASEDLCGTIELEAKLTGELKSYEDNTHAVERLVIVAKERIFLKAKLTADVSIQTITVHELRLVQGTTKRVLVVEGESQVPSIDYQTGGTFDPATEAGFSFLATYGTAPSDLFSSSGTGVYTFTVEADLTVTYRTTFGRKRDQESASMTIVNTLVLNAL